VKETFVIKLAKNRPNKVVGIFMYATNRHKAALCVPLQLEGSAPRGSLFVHDSSSGCEKIFKSNPRIIFLHSSNNNSMSSIDEDRRRRLRDIEVKIQDPRSIVNVDCLIDAVQNILSDCDHPAIRKIKNIDAFVSRCM
jgi:hypothetical protein